MPAEVAQTVQRALTAVVTDGTARRVNNAFTGADGKPLISAARPGPATTVSTGSRPAAR